MPELVYDPHLPVAYLNGAVIPLGKRPITGAEILEGLRSELMSDYEGADPKKFGLTKKQAMDKSLIDQAADGNLSAISMVHDRIAGKAIQQVQSLNVTTDLKDFLNRIIKNNNDPLNATEGDTGGSEPIDTNGTPSPF